MGRTVRCIGAPVVNIRQKSSQEPANRWPPVWGKKINFGPVAQTFRTFTNFVFLEIGHSWADYDRQDAHPQSQPGVRARVRRSSQDGDLQQQEAGPLYLPQLNRLHEAFHVREEDASKMHIPSLNLE